MQLRISGSSDPETATTPHAARLRTARTSRPSRLRTAWATAPCIAIALAACGGGGDASNGATGAAATDPSRSQALDAGSASDAGNASSWTTVAAEGENFDLATAQDVRYGSGSTWITRSVSGSASCSNAFFGNDPLFGVVKQCQVMAAAYTRIAGEGEAFNVDGTRTVRYGSGSVWIAQTVSGGGQCSNAWFGNDPVFGVVKQCEVADVAATPPSQPSPSPPSPSPAPSPATTWTRIAGENEGFLVNGVQNVRYGRGDTWATRSVDGRGDCSNAFFGYDPLFGVGKECQVADGGGSPIATLTPTPTPTPTPAPQPTAVAGVCTPPISAVDTSGTAPSVGNGTPESCTESALRSALADHDVVTFNCGAAPATIRVASEIAIRTDRDTVLDGGGRITLDGAGSTRILSLVRPDYRTNTKGLTLQHIALVNGKAAGTGFVQQEPDRPYCAWGYAGGSGAAINVRDARLHVIDAEFRNNAAASPGPDVGGGAIYAAGSLDITVVGSRFIGNTGSNSGAVGLLQSNGRFVNSVFEGNSATGSGQNSLAPECPGVGQAGQSGAGGNSGAIGVDGSDDTDLLVCGSRFVDNRANELGGALGRTPNNSPQPTTIDRSLFQGNRAKQAGAFFIVNSIPLDISATTFTGNSATAFGAAQIERSRLNLVNSTFDGNEATRGVGGALQVNSLDPQSVIRNATFANNKASGGPGYFSAAIFGQLDIPVLNTVFANNLTDDPWNPMQCGFSPGRGSFDLQWPLNRSSGGLGDTPCVQGIAFADPQLGGLADNGGPTPTLLPANGSPLRGAGRDCPATDQRGNPRNTGQCTIGAVE